MPALCGSTRRGALKDRLCEPAGPSDYTVPAAHAERSLLREAARRLQPRGNRSDGVW